MKIAFSGPRIITFAQEQTVEIVAREYSEHDWLVGDARGVDSLIAFLGFFPKIFYVEGRERWQYAARTKRMVAEAEVLVAFPNKPCPPVCTPRSGRAGGSGTWLAIALAKKRGIPIRLVPLAEFDFPDWL